MANYIPKPWFFLYNMGPISGSVHDQPTGKKFMLILRGAAALSEFRVQKIIDLCANAKLPVTDVYAEFMHFADVSAPLTSEEHSTLVAGDSPVMVHKSAVFQGLNARHW